MYIKLCLVFYYIMEDLICILYDPLCYKKHITFEINSELKKNIIEYLTKTYGKTAKINNDKFINFTIALISNKRLDEHTERYMCIAPCYYNWIENNLFMDASREYNLNKLSPFRYIDKGCKVKNIKKYDSLLVKIFTDVDDDILNDEDTYIDDPDEVGISDTYSIHRQYYFFLDNVIDQYISIDNVEFSQKGIICDREFSKNIIKNTIYEFIKTQSNINLKKTIVRIDKGESINSMKFNYCNDDVSYYFFDNTGKLYNKQNDLLNILG